MSHWFEYFPRNHMWSQGMMFGIEMAGWGAASISEIDQIGQKLRGHDCVTLRPDGRVGASGWRGFWGCEQHFAPSAV
jgi:hypothetical protein